MLSNSTSFLPEMQFDIAMPGKSTMGPWDRHFRQELEKLKRESEAQEKQVAPDEAIGVKSLCIFF